TTAVRGDPAGIDGAGRPAGEGRHGDGRARQGQGLSWDQSGALRFSPHLQDLDRRFQGLARGPLSPFPRTRFSHNFPSPLIPDGGVAYFFTKPHPGWGPNTPPPNLPGIKPQTPWARLSGRPAVRGCVSEGPRVTRAAYPLGGGGRAPPPLFGFAEVARAAG